MNIQLDIFKYWIWKYTESMDYRGELVVISSNYKTGGGVDSRLFFRGAFSFAVMFLMTTLPKSSDGDAAVF